MLSFVKVLKQEFYAIREEARLSPLPILQLKVQEKRMMLRKIQRFYGPGKIKGNIKTTIAILRKASV